MSKPVQPPRPPTESDRKAGLDEALDAALEQSFPASDPPAMTAPGGDEDPSDDELARQNRRP